jgi:histidinol phosphatase-like enzyme
LAPQLASEKINDRKPGIGMGLKAKALYPETDFTKSIMVGDSDSDIAFGNNLGMITVKIGDKDGSKEKADYYCDQLEDCIKLFKL